MKWDQNNPEKVKDFIAKMKQDYAFKKAYAARRAWEFYNHPAPRNYDRRNGRIRRV